MSMATTWLSGIYLAAVAGIGLFGFLGVITLVTFFRHRHRSYPCPKYSSESLPKVTVQLPIYNERYVIRRLIDGAAHLDYPKEKLQIQVIDDSTDETTGVAIDCVTSYQGQGFDIELIHRQDRAGYKAGALEEATRSSTGEFVAVFDADFVPDPDFLLKTVPHFIEDPRLGMVQARWGHLNPGESMLTEAQTIALDKHFLMEQTVRHRADFFPKFNGSAGVWRREAILDSGGWQADTVCEDLCLSTRAILHGWKFRFLSEVVAPAELPTTLSAYKNQQARWAKGSTQCLLRFGRPILNEKEQSPLARGYALLSMAGYSNHLLLLILLLIQVPLIALDFKPPIYLLLFGILGLSQPLLFIMGQVEGSPRWHRKLLYFPALLLIAIGLAPVNTRAILYALAGQKNVFVRTPKGSGSSHIQRNAYMDDLTGYELPFDWIVVVELLLALYAAAGLILCIIRGNLGPAAFLGACTIGLGYVGLKSAQEKLRLS